MHRSRLVGLLIDTPAAQAGAEVAFWSGALGTPTWSPPDEDQFTALVGAVPDFFTVVQSLDDGSARFHVDLETDDLDAEVARLTALGAQLVNRWKDAFTLRSPAGHLLCVVPLHSDPETFARNAHTWP